MPHFDGPVPAAPLPFSEFDDYVGQPIEEYVDPVYRDPEEEDEDRVIHPDYLGVVSGAEYKIDDGKVVQYALVILVGSTAYTIAAADSDLVYLARQIKGLLPQHAI